MRPTCDFRIPVTYHVKLEDGCSGAGHDGTTDLSASDESSSVPVGAEHSGQFALVVDRQIQGAGDVKSGRALKRDALHGVSVVGACVRELGK